MNIFRRSAALLGALSLLAFAPASAMEATSASPSPLLDVRESYRLLVSKPYAPVPRQTILDGARAALLKLAAAKHVRVDLPALQATDESSDIAALDSAIASVQAATHLPLATVAYSALDGMAAAMHDRWTMFFDPKQLRDFNRFLDPSKIFGIGVMIQPDPKTEYMRAAFVVPGTPADRAGIRRDDEFVSIDGVSVKGLKASAVSAKLRGRAGTPVTVGIERDEKPPFAITLNRSEIIPPTAIFKMLPHHIGYISVYAFGQATPDQVAIALERLDAQGARAYVLDLRGNGGGFVGSSLRILSFFLSGKPMLTVERRDRQDQTINAPDSRIPSKPMVVLVDGNTASASEITAGALRDDGVALLVGTKTFGKGVMQTLTDLPGRTAIKITTAHYLTPNHHDINLRGIVPDVSVKENKGAIWGDISKDAQLRVAVELLQKKIALAVKP